MLLRGWIDLRSTGYTQKALAHARRGHFLSRLTAVPGTFEPVIGHLKSEHRKGWN
ncbi:hypothetical protein H8A99_31190 [Bradyrhizobium sp. Arg68]|uniref:hypothetical protein n=1 Tax=Bradyrhizobium ivorense TaxID=2511166 RepID=UPI001E527EB1|nr:hypothetical protein [Bradyrhizobium ivorense]MCC8940785.1 hypothetical protein [Bradyrhizobium ivorense]